MGYVEFLRIRRMLTVYVAIVVGLTIFALIFHISPHDTTVAGHAHGHVAITGPPAPFGVLFLVAGFFTAIVATFLGTSLNQEHVEQAWTKPSSRVRYAAATIGVDVIALALAFIVTSLAFAIVTWVQLEALGIFDRIFAVDGRSIFYAAAGFGAVLMWYGLIQVATAWHDVRGGMFAGLSWPVFIFIPVIVALQLPPLLHGLAVGQSIFDPLTYLSIDSHGVPPLTSVANADHALFTGFIALVACAVAVAAWRRMEV